jgi:hypothetical protein
MENLCNRIKLSVIFIFDQDDGELLVMASGIWSL